MTLFILLQKEAANVLDYVFVCVYSWDGSVHGFVCVWKLDAVLLP